MGLLAYIYKHGGNDYSNNGVSARANEVCLVNVDGPFDPDERHPAAFLVQGNVKGTLKVVPAERLNKQVMFGGAYIATSDSRFNQAAEKILGHPFYGAVPFHDRVE